MEQFTATVLDLLEDNRNEIKLALKNYVDYTVDSKFDDIKKVVLSLAQTGGKSNRNSSDRASKRSSAQPTLELAVAVTSDVPSEASAVDMAGPSTSASPPQQHKLVNGDFNETATAALDPDCVETAEKKPSDIAVSSPKKVKKKTSQKKSPIKSGRGTGAAVQAAVSAVQPSAASTTAPRASQRKRVPKKVGFGELSFDLSNAAKVIARKSEAKRKVAEPNESVKKVKRDIGDKQPVAINNNPKQFRCTWDNCSQSYNHRGDAVRHVRVQHFHLPKSMNEQVKKNIVDNRDPNAYIQHAI